MSLSRNMIMPKSLGLATLLAAILIAPACTDLTEVPRSSITPENFYRNEDEVIGGLASVYAQLRSTTDEAYNITEISTDEMIVPTRGQDWYDNGKWLDIHRQTFTPNSPAGLDNINSAFVNLFTGVARANVVLNGIENVNFANKSTVVAELRALRAFYYYDLMDLFGGVPIVEDVAIQPREANTRAEVFQYIESELNAIRADLPVSWPAEMNGRLTRGAADAMLASLYLNSEVFTGTVSATGLAKGTPRWQDAITAADRVLTSGQYSLANPWRLNFTANNNTSPEIIFAVKFVAVPDIGNNFLMRAIHYNQYEGGETPWNGFATLADTYNAFDANDIRKQIFLAGPQLNLATGLPINDRAGKPLVYDPNIPDVTQADEAAGVRIAKWPLDPNHVARNNGNDYAFFRLAEMYLIKAEAQNELGDPATAAATINTTTRARAFPTSPKPIPLNLTQAQMRDTILQERLFEFTAEGKRRQDLIRANKYTQGTWYAKTENKPYKVLFPIPQIQIDNNPLLKQNPGY